MEAGLELRGMEPGAPQGLSITVPIKVIRLKQFDGSHRSIAQRDLIPVLDAQLRDPVTGPLINLEPSSSGVSVMDVIVLSDNYQLRTRV